MEWYRLLSVVPTAAIATVPLIVIEGGRVSHLVGVRVLRAVKAVDAVPFIMESCLGALGDSTARCLLADPFLLNNLASLFPRDHGVMPRVSHRGIRHDLADYILSDWVAIYLLRAVVNHAWVTQ